MEDILTIVAVCLVASFIFSELFYRFKYPRIMGQIFAGVMLGLPFFRNFFSEEAISLIKFLADLGIIFLLLLTGMQLNIAKFRKAERDSAIIAFFCVLVPFIFGFALMKFLGYSTIVAVVVGAAFSLTGEAPKLKVLLDLKALNTRVGVIMLSAGILDDVFEVIFLSIVLFLANEAYGALAILPFKILLFVGIVFMTYKLFPLLLRTIQKERSRVATFSFIVMFGIITAVVSKNLELGPIIGAFIAGIIIHLSDRRKYEHKENIKELEAMTFALIIPFFFINIGLNFDVVSLSTNIWLAVLILFSGTAGKLVGSVAATPLTKLSLKQANLIGWGMNSRGAIELVIADVARSADLIPIEVFSSIVFMSVVTTMVFPLVLKYAVGQDRNILN